MRSKAPIIIENEGQPPDDWRRFVAAMCFIHFYTWFILGGQSVFNLFERRGPWEYNEPLWALMSASEVCAALAFWGLGRALWQGRPTVGWWLRRVLLFSALMIFFDNLALFPFADTGTEMSHQTTTWRGWEIKSNSSPVLWKALRIALTNCQYLPLLGLLIGTVAVAIVIRKWRGGFRRPWVYVAVAWSLSILLQYALYDPSWTWQIPRFFSAPLSIDQLWWLDRLHFIGLPLLTVGSLLFVKEGVWLCPLAMAVMTALHPLPYALWSVNYFLHTRGLAHLALNSDVFKVLFVYSVQNALPWLLIAWYAYRLSTRMPVGDGSPFPRRYCGKCHYNLCGIDSPRCPECGVELVPTVDDE
ncbi:MAG: hypothetical protein GX616_09760 [Planctomycetes bacterium]|nr:hypothetical protein [Planctomycetota bacterium]